MNFYLTSLDIIWFITLSCDVGIVSIFSLTCVVGNTSRIDHVLLKFTFSLSFTILSEGTRGEAFWFLFKTGISCNHLSIEGLYSKVEVEPE